VAAHAAREQQLNIFQRFAIRLAAKIAPPLGAVLRSAGGTVDRLQEQNLMLRDMLDDQRVTLNREAQDLREAIAMASGGMWRPSNGWHKSGQRQPVQANEAAVVPLKERLAELELALEDRGWSRQIALAALEFSRYGIQQIILISRLYFVKNPLINRGVLISAYYVFGRGVEVSCEDKPANKAIDKFFSDPRNATEISHIGLVEKDAALQTDGNLFWALFTSVDDGAVLVRTIEATEIEEVICDPQDSATPWYYHRRYMQMDFNPANGLTTPTAQECWYVALGFEPPPGLTEIAGNPLMKDPKTSEFIPILHTKDGGLAKWHFGCPSVYGAIDWARAYRHGLEDYCSMKRAHARFSWGVETQGGTPAIAAWRQSLATTLANSESSIETNPPPVVASALVTGPGNKVTPFRTAGMQDSPEELRRVLLMVCAHFGLPECYDDQTEVLTDQGFMLHQQWTPGVKVACFNPETSKIEYHHPKALAVHDYTGEMVAFRNGQTDILVTPNHRMWCAPMVNWRAKDPEVNRGWRIEEAGNVEQSHRTNGWQFSTQILPTEEQVGEIETPIGAQDPVQWARVLGYWIAEGCATASVCKSGEFRKDGSPIMRTFRRVMFAQQPGQVLDNMRASLRSVDVKFHEVVATAGVVNLVIVRKMLWEYLRAECGPNSHAKRIPRWVLTAQRPVRQAMFDALMEGDGGKSGSSLRYSTVSKQLADDVQILAHSLGMAASISPDNQPYNGEPHCTWRVLIRLEWTDKSVIRPKHISRQSYAGKVYCFSVPHTIYVTRRNGKIAIQGNTFFGDASTGSLATAVSLDRPTELKFKQRQEKWKVVLKLLSGYVLYRSAMAPGGVLRESLNGEADLGEAASKKLKAIKVKVAFPSVLEHDITAMIAAIVNAATLDGFEVTGIDEKVAVRLMLEELGYEEAEELVEKMYPSTGPDKYDPLRTAEDLGVTAPPPGAPGAPGSTPAAGTPPPETSGSQRPAQQQGNPPGERKPPSRINPQTGAKESARLVAELRRALIALRERKA
jgi:hypothetical protein